MHQDHTIINQKQRNKLQREQVPWTPTRSRRRKHQMSAKSRKQRLHPKVQLCRKILCPALAPVKNYLWVSCNIRICLVVIPSYLLCLLSYDSTISISKTFSCLLISFFLDIIPEDIAMRTIFFCFKITF